MGDFCLSFWHPIHTLAKESEEIQEAVTFQGHLPTHHSALFTWLRSCVLGGLTVIRGTTAGITSSNSWGVMRGNSGPQRRDKGHQTWSLQSGTCQRECDIDSSTFPKNSFRFMYMGQSGLNSVDFLHKRTTTWEASHLCRSMCLPQRRWGNDIRRFLPWKKYREVFTLHHSFLCSCLLVLWDAVSLLHTTCKRDPWRLGFPSKRLVEPCTGIFPVLFLGWERERKGLPLFDEPWVFEPGHSNCQCEGLSAGLDLSPECQGSHRPLHTLSWSLCCPSTGAFPQLSLHHEPWRQVLQSVPHAVHILWLWVCPRARKRFFLLLVWELVLEST